ncbi:Protein AMBP [Acipenser ruthenus]|uniref:Protein AMBP n=1 Tax=Acipenser ruthenus TaxID=7906 RepID=A0A444U0C9_ACIRT|nr:Protein AMBP [Acipenser ruthenus]
MERGTLCYREASTPRDTGRTQELRPSLLAEFKQFALEQGFGEDTFQILPKTDSCKLPQDQGPCFGYETRFFYNATLMTCQEFSYGGCLGNENNFVTEKECLQSCRTEAVCRLPIQSGSCTTSTELWAFDSTSGKCVPFKYSSCQGNGNRFYTQKECEEYCGTLRDGRGSFKLSPQCILVLVVLNLLKKRETGEKIPECTWM